MSTRISSHFSILRALSARVPAVGLRGAVFCFAIVLLAACSDVAPTAPQPIDRVAAARVMPSVTDARVRLAPSIENDAVRTRVEHDLQELESALANGDAQKARFHLHIVANVLTDYRKQQGIVMKDGADISAIGLMVSAVSDVVHGGVVFAAL